MLHASRDAWRGASGRYLGEALISAGFGKGAQVDFVLRIQQRLATVAKLRQAAGLRD